VHVEPLESTAHTLRRKPLHERFRAGEGGERPFPIGVNQETRSIRSAHLLTLTTHGHSRVPTISGYAVGRQEAISEAAIVRTCYGGLTSNPYGYPLRADVVELTPQILRSLYAPRLRD
jgi:hypothetical protein